MGCNHEKQRNVQSPVNIAQICNPIPCHTTRHHHGDKRGVKGAVHPCGDHSLCLGCARRMIWRAVAIAQVKPRQHSQKDCRSKADMHPSHGDVIADMGGTRLQGGDRAFHRFIEQPLHPNGRKDDPMQNDLCGAIGCWYLRN